MNATNNEYELASTITERSFFVVVVLTMKLMRIKIDEQNAKVTLQNYTRIIVIIGLFEISYQIYS